MNSFICWVGGKRQLAKTIVGLIPEHTCYVELFCGAAWVFFRKEPSKVEVLNDRDNELVNLYRIVRHHPDEFLREFEHLIASRSMFADHKDFDPKGLTDIQRATRFYYVLKLAFAGRIQQNPAYGYSPTRRVLNHARVPEIISEVHERIRRVNIECLDFADCIKRYDRLGTLFYADPPYWGTDDYRVEFSEADHERLCTALSGVQGRFILSMNDVPEVRKMYRKFNIREVEVFYTSSRVSRSYHPELIIANFEI